MEAFFTLPNILNLITLTGLEIILGIDNVIFIALLVEPLAPKLRNTVRLYGLSLALILRVIMLFGVSWIIGLTKPLFTIFSFPLAGRNILLIVGGLFLIIKTIHEFMEMFSKENEKAITPVSAQKKLLNIIIQIIFVDLILSFDSVITAVGMSPDNITVIIVAVVISMVIMLISSKPIGDFIYAYPSIKVIGLSFIALVGIMLVANGFNINVPKAYLYFAIFFSSTVETINILLSKKNKQ
jgi:predicted tellurium resistance membrane protein TerC